MNEESATKSIEILAINLCQHMDELAELKSKVQEKEKIVNQIKTKELAELVDMEGYQVGSKIMLSNGKTILVKEFFTSNIPSLTQIAKEKDPDKQWQMQERRALAFKWLDDKGKGDIIKNTVTAKFNREEGEKAKLLIKWLIEKGINAERDENVHSSTLNSTLKEAMGNGEEVPMNIFGIYKGVVVDVK